MHEACKRIPFASAATWLPMPGLSCVAKLLFNWSPKPYV